MSNAVAPRPERGHRRGRGVYLVMAFAAMTVWGGVAYFDAAAQDKSPTDKSAARQSFEHLPPGFAGAFLAAEQAASRGDLMAAALYYRRALRAKPDDPRLLSLALRFALMTGDVTSSALLADRMAVGRAASSGPGLVLGVRALLEDRYDDALVLFRDSAGQTTPILKDLVMGWAAYGAGDAEAAFGYFLSNQGESGKGIFGNEHAAYLAAATGDAARAAEYFEASAAALGGWSRELALAAAAAHQAAGDARRAGDFLAKGLEASPRDDVILAAAARLERGEQIMAPVDSAERGVAAALVGVATAIGAERPEAAELGLIYAQIARKVAPDYDLAHILAGERLTDLEQHDLAVFAFEDVAEESPLRISAVYGRAVAIGQGGDAAEAIDQLLAMIEGGAQSPDALLALGVFTATEQRFVECAEAYEAALDRLKAIYGAYQTGQWSIFFRAGICRERADEWEAAEAHFKGALALDPEQPDVLNYFGYSLVEQRRRFDEAREMIERAVALRPDSGHIIDSLGWVMWRTGDFAGAVRELARAIELEPQVYEINDHYGDALWMVGRKREARFHWKRALYFEPEDAQVRARIERKLAIGLDALLEEEGDTPPRRIDESANPSVGGARRGQGG